METLTVDKKAIVDLAKLMDEMQDRIESLELMGDSAFMKSLKQSDKEIENREFVDFDGL